MGTGAAAGLYGAGTPILAILALLSLFSLALIFQKTAELWHARSGAEIRDEALERLRAGDALAAESRLQDGRAPADRVARRGVALIADGSGAALLVAELNRLGNSEVAALYARIRILELIAMISPLLGLLGTVLGMIQSFRALEFAEGAANASILAGGIWQALLTTAAGLVVAIPSAVGAALLAARAEAAANDIEAEIARLGQLAATAPKAAE